MDSSHYCIFGDSVVQGCYVKTCWADHLRQYLEKKYNNNYVVVCNLGVSADTTEGLLTRFDNEASFRTPTSLTIAIGVNDTLYIKEKNNTAIKKDAFRDNLNKLVSKAKAFTNDITFVGLVLGDDSILKPFPESDTGKCYDRELVKQYDNIISEVAKANECKFIPLYDKLNFEDFFDGLHPNDNGHQKMFEEIKKYF